MSPKHPASLAAAVALAAALAVTGCDRSTGAPGATTIIQNNPATTSAPNALAKPSVTPISDPKELCHQVRVKTRDLDLALKKYWSLVSGDGSRNKSINDPDIREAANKVIDLAGKTNPELQGIVGGSTPNSLATVVNSYIQTLQEFSNAIEENTPGDEASALASKYGNQLDALNAACKI